MLTFDKSQSVQMSPIGIPARACDRACDKAFVDRRNPFGIGSAPDVQGSDKAGCLQALAHRQTIWTLDKSSVAFGHLSLSFSIALTTVCAMTWSRYHLRSAGTMCHGAHSVLQQLSASS